MLSITDWGIVYLLLLFVVLIFFQKWLPALLIFSTVVHAASVVNVSAASRSYGLTTYNITAFFGALLWLRNLTQAPLRIHVSLRLPTILLLLYAFVAIIGSWWLPHHFAGTLVLQADEYWAFDGSYKAVQWGLFNLVQAANLLVHVLMLLYLLQSTTLDLLTRQRVMIGLAAGFVLVLAVGFYERGALLFGWSSHFSFWSSNPNYTQVGIGDGGLGMRIGLPFSEPSFASAYLAAVSASCIALTLWGKRVLFGLFALLFSIFATVNTMGATGVVATAILTPLMFFLFSYQSFAKRHTRPELLRRWIIFMLAICSLTILAATTEFIREYVKIFHQQYALHVEKLRFEVAGKYVRYQLDHRGLEVLLETGGLGIGLGSARMSSFGVSLLAATGIPGALLWVGSLGALAWRYFKAPRLGDGQLVAIAGLLGSTLAMLLAIPDLNMPMYWSFIFLAFIFCPERQASEKSIQAA